MLPCPPPSCVSSVVPVLFVSFQAGRRFTNHRILYTPAAHLCSIIHTCLLFKDRASLPFPNLFCNPQRGSLAHRTRVSLMPLALLVLCSNASNRCSSLAQHPIRWQQHLFQTLQCTDDCQDKDLKLQSDFP